MSTYPTINENWGYPSDLMQSVVLTPDGVFNTCDCSFEGSLCIFKKVYRSDQFIIFENVYHLIFYFVRNREKMKSIGFEFKMDLDDDNCCADGFISIQKNGKHQKGFFVPFSESIHNEIGRVIRLAKQ